MKAAPHTDSELIDLNRRLKKKYDLMRNREQRYERICVDDASLVVVAFGSSARISLDAIARARRDHLPVGLFRPISLWPFPADAMRSLVGGGVMKFLVVEANNGQMVEDVRLAVCGEASVSHYGFGGGHIFSPDEIYAEISRLCRET